MMERICKECLLKPAAKQKTRCHCCIKRQQNQDVIKASYYNLRGNAKRRNKEFDLTLEQFREFCIRTEYHLGKGKTKTSYSIDRIDDNKGYTLDNIRILTLSENTQKENLRRKQLVCDWENGNRFTFKPLLTFENQFSDVPF